MAEQKLPIKPEYLLDVILRWRWLIMLPLCASLLVGIYFSIVLPKVYEAQTVILVEPQRVPTEYVQSVVSIDLNSRINTISQQILSRTNLEKIIQQFGLFQGAAYASMYTEDKIASLRKRIKVDVTQSRNRRTTDSFSITFKDRSPQKVMDITNSLASFFIDENLKVREAEAVGTSAFLDSELDSMRRRLEQVEEKLKDFRKMHMGELPEQLDSNLSILENLQAQIIDRQQALREARNRLADLESQPTQQLTVIPGQTMQIQGSPEEVRLMELKNELAQLQVRYTEQHPDIIRLKGMIRDQEQQVLAAAGNNTDGTAHAMANQGSNTVTRRQRRELERDIATFTSEIADIQKDVVVYQQRVENTPKREQELLSLRRDYDNIQESYNSLLARRLEAEISVNMERKQKGEQFRVIDPARLPQRPVEPDMRKLFLMFVAAGLGLGGGIVFLLEFLNNSFKDPDDVEETLGFPVLGAMPPIWDERALKRKRLNTIFSSVCLVVTFTLFGGFALITVKGVEPIMKLVGPWL